MSRAAMATVSEHLRDGIERLRASGSESPRLDAELLLARAIQADRTAIIAHPDAPVGADAAAGYEVAIARRMAGEPVAYIRGFKEFHGLALAVDARALIPRPETELLVDLAADEIADRLTGSPRPPGGHPIRVADVGTGSGAIAVALAAALRRRRMVREVVIVATDASSDALDLARENAVSHGVADQLRFVETDLLPPVVDPQFEVILANLPYIPSAVVPGLPVAASFEPVSALDGGPDGLAVIRRLLERLPGAMSEDGVALLEIGADQGQSIRAASAVILPGWACGVMDDLAGLPRVARIERIERLAPNRSGARPAALPRPPRPSWRPFRGGSG